MGYGTIYETSASVQTNPLIDEEDYVKSPTDGADPGLYLCGSRVFELDEGLSGEGVTSCSEGRELSLNSCKSVFYVQSETELQTTGSWTAATEPPVLHQYIRTLEILQRAEKQRPERSRCS